MKNNKSLILSMALLGAVGATGLIHINGNAASTQSQPNKPKTTQNVNKVSATNNKDTLLTNKNNSNNRIKVDSVHKISNNFKVKATSPESRIISFGNKNIPYSDDHFPRANNINDVHVGKRYPKAHAGIGAFDFTVPGSNNTYMATNDSPLGKQLMSNNSHKSKLMTARQTRNWLNTGNPNNAEESQAGSPGMRMDSDYHTPAVSDPWNVRIYGTKTNNLGNYISYKFPGDKYTNDTYQGSPLYNELLSYMHANTNQQTSESNDTGNNNGTSAQSINSNADNYNQQNEQQGNNQLPQTNEPKNAKDVALVGLSALASSVALMGVDSTKHKMLNRRLKSRI